MADELKKLFKSLPPVEPKKETLDRIIVEIVKEQIQKLWKKRLALGGSFLAIVLGAITVKKITELVRAFGTVGFWQFLINDLSWWTKNYQALAEAFLEAQPLKEIIALILLFLTIFFFFSLIFLEKTSKRLLTVLVIVIFFLSGVYYFFSKKLTFTLPGETFVSNFQESDFSKPKNVSIPTPFFLEVSSPQDEETFSQAVIEVKGKTVAGAEVFINDLPAKVAEDGSFYQSFELEEGENFILISAGNENGEAEIERHVYFELP